MLLSVWPASPSSLTHRTPLIEGALLTQDWGPADEMPGWTAQLGILCRVNWLHDGPGLTSCSLVTVMAPAERVRSSHFDDGLLGILSSWHRSAESLPSGQMAARGVHPEAVPLPRESAPHWFAAMRRHGSCDVSLSSAAPKAEAPSILHALTLLRNPGVSDPTTGTRDSLK